MGMTQDYSSLDATAVIAGFQSETLSTEAYAEFITDQVQAHSALNAISFFDASTLKSRMSSALSNHPKGALAGLPIVAKDNINTTCFPTSAGTPALLDHVPESDAPVVNMIDSAGGLIGAKAGMHELAFGITSNNAATGAIHNPAAPDLIPGGSSGGTAAAIGAGIFPMGLGSDTGGSCRIPAALCGTVGYRPSSGRYSQNGVIPISRTKDTVGSLARSVRDIALMDSVLAAESSPISGVDLGNIRFGVPTKGYFDTLDPEVEAVIESALNALVKAGVTLVEVDASELLELNKVTSSPLVAAESKEGLAQYLKEYAPHISFDQLVSQIKSPDVARVFAAIGPDSAQQLSAYQEAINTHIPAMKQKYHQIFKDNDLTGMIFPTTPITARPIGQDEQVSINGQNYGTFPTYVRNTDPSTNIGAPGISIPCPVGGGLPVGLECDALPGQDRVLLGIAQAIEQALR